MTLDDLPEIEQLEVRCFPNPWTATYYRNELTTNPYSHYWVLRPQPDNLQPGDEAGIVSPLPPILAYGGYWIFGEESHIVTIASHPDWRGHGLGERLLTDMLSAMQAQGVVDATLEVRAGNAPAIGLYTKFGFEEVGRRPRYYPDGEDALLLTRFGIGEASER
jgi:ribosomal-protein-alanine N-acetyltransferase